MGISMVLLLMEHFYMRYLQTHVQKTTDNGCCALISQVSKGQLISDHEKYFLFRVLKSLTGKIHRYHKFENTKNWLPKSQWTKKECCALISQLIIGQLISDHHIVSNFQFLLQNYHDKIRRHQAAVFKFTSHSAYVATDTESNGAKIDGF